MNVREELARYHEDAFHWALHCARRDWDFAQEVLQASYLKVLAGQAVFGGRSAFKTWLFGVIRRTAAEHRRWAWIGGRSVGATLVVALPAADEALIADEEARRLRAALDRLSPKQREVLVLVFYHELTIEEAAEVMKIGLGSARTHYARAKARLRTML